MDQTTKIVITNDDGYDQPGLAVLVEAVKPFGRVTIVAPATPQSNVGHKVSLKEPIRVDRISDITYVVHATPADCSRLAIKEILPDVDWVIAGINPGANLGSDVYQSGTVAAAREAAILGVPAIAVSQYIAPDWTIDWEAAKAQMAPLLSDLMRKRPKPKQFWNVNLPSPITADLTLDREYCPLDTNPHRYQYIEKNGVYRYKGVIHDRPRTDGSDVDVCFGGVISITLLEI
jgi:5'-nucleotidase